MHDIVYYNQYPKAIPPVKEFIEWWREKGYDFRPLYVFDDWLREEYGIRFRVESSNIMIFDEEKAVLFKLKYNE